MLSRFGVWLLVGVCNEPARCESAERLGRLVSMVLSWIETASTLRRDYVGELLKRLTSQYVCRWLTQVRDNKLDVLCACLSPNPPSYVKVGGCWDAMSSIERQHMEGLHRLCCVVPHGIITSEVRTVFFCGVISWNVFWLCLNNSFVICSPNLFRCGRLSCPNGWKRSRQMSRQKIWEGLKFCWRKFVSGWNGASYFRYFSPISKQFEYQALIRQIRNCIGNLRYTVTFLLNFSRKIFDPLLTPLKLPPETTLGFIRKALESAVPRHQVEALTWLQVNRFFSIIYLSLQRMKPIKRPDRHYSAAVS